MASYQGMLLSNRYEIIARIGGGGMAEVYKARDTLLNRYVAVKILRPQYATDETFISLFSREAQAAASLSHPNVVNIYDVGVQDDLHYIVMEYIEGETLKDKIIREAPLPCEEAVRIALEILDALDHAHKNRIIHRDIKPHNILIGVSGRVKVTDFGIARAVTSATIAQTGTVLGSVHYFSPEQAKGTMVDERSDLYSMGIVLYEMLTGELPFSGESPFSVAIKHLQESFPDPRQLNPAIPQSVENVILRALAKTPSYRYDSAREMIDDLSTALHPSRRNEAKLVLALEDQETKVLPKMNGFVDQEDDAFEPSEGRPKRWRWGLKWLWRLAVVLIFAGGVLSFFNYVFAKLYVPDVTVPDVVGSQQEDAERILAEKGLLAKVVKQFDETAPEGVVFRQDPEGEQVVKKNSEVTLYVSKGKQKIAMPNLIGKPKSTVQFLLDEEHFKQVNFNEAYSDEEAGLIIGQSPQPDEEVVPEEVTVTLTVSKGKGSFPMPNLVGEYLSVAQNILLRNNLVLGEVTYDTSYMEAGKVFRQFPKKAGEMVSPQETIDLYVSSGYPPEAKQVNQDVEVDPDGQSVPVKIVVNDATGEHERVNQTIAEPTHFTIPLVLSPKKDGDIKIYLNNNLYKEVVVPYER